MHNILLLGGGKRETVSIQLYINSRTKQRMNQGNFFILLSANLTQVCFQLLAAQSLFSTGHF